jgi:hypothetical protein
MDLDKKSPVELFTCRRPFGHPRLMVYRRFTDVDEALRYAVEEIPRDALPGAVIEVNGTRMKLQGNPKALQGTQRSEPTSSSMHSPKVKKIKPEGECMSAQ